MNLEQILEITKPIKNEARHWLRELFRNLYDVTVYQANNKAQTKKAKEQQLLGYINRFNTIMRSLESYGYKVTITIKKMEP